MKWIGLTGGIASGKSTAAALLRDQGLAVIDADALAREVVEPGTPGLQSVVRAFGPGILDSQGHLDRKALGKIAFGDLKKREELEAILHPLIQAETKLRRSSLEKKGAKVAFYDVPLLFEKDLAKGFDSVVLISCRRETQEARMRSRDQLTDQEIQNRLAAQWPLQKKEGLANYVIHNDGTKEELSSQISNLIKQIQSGIA